MLDTKTLVQRVLDKDAAGINEAFSAILEQKIAERLEEITPAIAADLFDLEEKAKFDDDDGEEYSEKKSKKDKEKSRADARASKKKDVDEEVDLEEGLRLVAKHEHGNYTAKVYKDTDWGEHRVKYFKDGKHLPKADSHHDDAEDAHGTAKAELKRMNESEDLQELNKSTLGSYIKKASTSAYINHAMPQRRQDDSHLRRRDSEVHKKRGDHVKAAEADDDSFAADHAAQKHSSKVLKRTIGIGRAGKRLAKEEFTTEEATQILEDLQEGKIPGQEHAPADLVALHVDHMKHMSIARDAMGYGYNGSVGSAAEAKSAISKAAGLEKEIGDHPETKAFHEKHGWKKEHPAKRIAMATSHLHESENLEEKAKFDDENGDDYISKLAKKAKEKARDKARETKTKSKDSE
jgi:hypothetical protein